MKNIPFILFLICLFSLSTGIFVFLWQTAERRIEILSTKLCAYRVINGRSLGKLECRQEIKILNKVCLENPELIPPLWSQRLYENGMPGHEYGFKRFFVLSKYEQAESAKILLIQEMTQYCFGDKHRKEFILAWGKRINCKDTTAWSKGISAILREEEKKF